jgi:uncharacterized protein (DUF1501 family)
MGASRREFLASCSAAVAAFAGARISHASFAASDGSAGAESKSARAFVGPPSPNSTSANSITPASDTLIVLFLRGGMDGLHLLGPTDDKHYIAARDENLRVVGKGPKAGVSLSQDLAPLDFRLHPEAAPLKELYDSGLLAFVHACGITSGTRSHFEAMDLIERGLSHEGGHAGQGWLTRHLHALERVQGGTLGAAPAFAAMDGLPSSLLGFERALSGKQAKALSLWQGESQVRALRAMYSEDQLFHAHARTALGAMEAIASKLPREKDGDIAPYVPSDGADYPDGDLSESLQTLAQLVKAGAGLRTACVDFGGWDTHQTQSYLFPTRVRELARCLKAFSHDMHNHLSSVSVVVLSEFGRRLKANRSDGTDHGHGTVMMALGGNVRGGRIYGSWPGLATEQLDSGADLAVTTDHRLVLAELLRKRTGNADIASVFPGLLPATGNASGAGPLPAELGIFV